MRCCRSGLQDISILPDCVHHDGLRCCIPRQTHDTHAWYAGWKTRDGGGVVSLASRFRVLAFWRRYIHPKLVRATESTGCCCGGGSCAVGARQSCYRCFPIDQCTNGDAGARPPANHLSAGAPEQTLYSGKLLSYNTLCLYCFLFRTAAVAHCLFNRKVPLSGS